MTLALLIAFICASCADIVSTVLSLSTNPENKKERPRELNVALAWLFKVIGPDEVPLIGMKVIGIVAMIWIRDSIAPVTHFRGYEIETAPFLAGVLAAGTALTLRTAYINFRLWLKYRSPHA